jgi:2-polyprenyl-3-methyl-5-hydroxy-6-metoxy-1,4-benzoquinol methylase
MSETERERLEGAAQHFSTYGGAEGRVVEFGYRSIEPWLTGATCLELGPADGQLTAHLRTRFDTVISVEGSESFATTLRSTHGEPGNHRIVVSLFEEYEPTIKFDVIVAARIMEHVDDPVGLYEILKGWIAPGGSLIIQVPNALSFHRLLGVKLGALTRPDELNEHDIQVGHRRVYDKQMLIGELEKAGWEIIEFKGAFFKVFSNKQMDEWFTPELMDAFYALGSDFPDNATVISVRCR